MGAPRTLEIDESLDEIDGDLRHTEVFLTAYSLTADLAGPYATLRQQLRQRQAEESALNDAILLARALTFAADDELNRLVDDTKNALLAQSGADYQAPLYKQLFAGHSPSELKRPLLGDQLAIMRTWIGPLNAAAEAELSAIATRLTAAITKADDAATKTALAHQAMDHFKTGPRAAFIEQCNALRKLTYGKLAELAHSHSELPNDFLERFFATSGSRTPTIAEMTQSVERLRAKLKRQETALEAAKDKATQQWKATREAELAERKAHLDSAQKRAADAAAEVAKLQAELDAGPSK